VHPHRRAAGRSHCRHSAVCGATQGQLAYSTRSRTRASTHIRPNTEEVFRCLREAGAVLRRSEGVAPRPVVRQRHRKLFNQWVGPFTIVSFLMPITALVRCDTTHKRQRVHVDRLSTCAVEAETAQSTEPQSTSPILSSGDAANSSPTSSLPVTRTRTGRAIRTPARYTL